MRALVVYESMYGNTRTVALAIAEGIGAAMPVEAVEVGAAPGAIPGDVGLLVVGGPTHAHGMTKPQTRTDAAKRAGDQLVSRGAGIREWLEGLGGGSSPVAAAAFDTRIKGPGLLWGSAARGADKLLRNHGCEVIAGPRSFLVEGPTGPVFDRLVDGELERARRWGESLAAAVAAPAPER